MDLRKALASGRPFRRRRKHTVWLDSIGEGVSQQEPGDAMEADGETIAVFFGTVDGKHMSMFCTDVIADDYELKP